MSTSLSNAVGLQRSSDELNLFTPHYWHSRGFFLFCFFQSVARAPPWHFLNTEWWNIFFCMCIYSGAVPVRFCNRRKKKKEEKFLPYPTAAKKSIVIDVIELCIFRHSVRLSSSRRRNVKAANSLGHVFLCWSWRHPFMHLILVLQLSIVLVIE